MGFRDDCFQNECLYRRNYCTRPTLTLHQCGWLNVTEFKTYRKTIYEKEEKSFQCSFISKTQSKSNRNVNKKGRFHFNVMWKCPHSEWKCTHAKSYGQKLKVGACEPCDHRRNTSKRIFGPQTISRTSFSSWSSVDVVVEAHAALSAILIFNRFYMFSFYSLKFTSIELAHAN